MMFYKRAFVFILGPLLLVCSAVDAQTYRVVGVSDGDTLTALDESKRQVKVRLAGIDAPERGQDFSNRAKQNLSRMVFGKQITLEGGKIDRYGRRVAKVIVNGVDANLEQIKAGLAWHFKRYADEQPAKDQREYAAAEIEARKAKRGIWSIASPVAPWDFRDGKGTPEAVEGLIIGNRRSRVYHAPGCPSYNRVSPQNRVMFKTAAEAEKAGYRKAGNCR
ncbi:MAG: thermonuclease family protein [Acidobacteria bacterium]|nr:thermonuclease family protein [Acidobacteriota bacterium]